MTASREGCPGCCVITTLYGCLGACFTLTGQERRSSLGALCKKEVHQMPVSTTPEPAGLFPPDAALLTERRGEGGKVLLELDPGRYRVLAPGARFMGIVVASLVTESTTDADTRMPCPVETVTSA